MTSVRVVVASGERRPILGLKLEYKLAPNWALEWNALHREVKSTTTYFQTIVNQPNTGILFPQVGPTTQTLTPWEFPLLAKFSLPIRKFHPFLTAGPSFRPAGSGSGLSHVGFTAGGGAEFYAARLRFSPALRYTRWTPRNAGQDFGPLLDQVELLVGIDRPSQKQGFRVLGQRLSLGVIAGIGLGHDFNTVDPGVTSEAYSGIYGVAVEAALAKHFAVEVDGLYRPLHGSGSEFGRRVRFAHLTWEFPVLLKYRILGRGRWRPFVEAGPTFRAQGNLNLNLPSSAGISAGGGVELSLGRFRVAPTLRSNHWGSLTNNRDPQRWGNQFLICFRYSASRHSRN